MKHRFFVLLVLLEILAAGGLYLHGRATREELLGRLEIGRETVNALALTDPALWSEAHYTRNPTQSDRFAPFQDFPGALEHFPAGSLIGPPASLRGEEIP